MKRRLGDRRGRPRFEIVGDLWGTLDTVIGMPLVNIGRGGALVQSSVPLAPESIHHVALNCEGQPTPASVQVRHVRSITGSDGRQQYLIGLAFLSMPVALQSQIDAWMDDEAEVATNGL
jgi:hypothetical protein